LESDCDVLVCSVGEGMLQTRMKVCSELWECGIKAQFVHAEEPKYAEEIEYCHKKGVAWVIILKMGAPVRIKNLIKKFEAEVKLNEICKYFNFLASKKKVK
jgi:histidyl-tRNA synthetase